MNGIKEFIKIKAQNMLGINEVSERLQSIEKKLCPLSQSVFPKVNQDRSLFIVGLARSGTTILANALNYGSDGIYLFGEALTSSTIIPYAEYDTKNCIVQYNFYRMDAYNENMNSIGAYCHPKFFAPSKTPQFLPINYSTFLEQIRYLQNYYKYVGDKIALGIFVGSLSRYHYNITDFLKSNFISSTYICVVRNIDCVIQSILKKWPNFGKSENYYIILYGICYSYWTILNIYFSLPRVYILKHEQISQTSFTRISEILNLDVSSGFELYKKKEIEKIQHDICKCEYYEELKILSENIQSNIDNEKLSFTDRKLAFEQFGYDICALLNKFKAILTQIGKEEIC
jgi:hypothetical protein